MTTNTWTPDKVAELERLYRAGELTVSEIGEGLGFTKNAVCGKILRLGLANPNRVPAKRKLNPMKKPRAKKRAKPPKRRTNPLNLKPLEPDPLGDVAGGCQWLHGEPTDRNFCGNPRQVSSPYCDHHHERCYMPAPKKKRKAEDRVNLSGMRMA